ncbi:MAG: Holliday junction resolvase RuvX [Chromatiales bacterium]|nr:Holliday junction resolvase RuvX [Chromatiales bacterium]
MTTAGSTGRPVRSVLAFDFGLRRIGVAQADARVSMANPVTTLGAKAGAPDWGQLDVLVKEWGPDALVVGVPCEPDGSHGPGSQPALAFSRLLGARYPLSVMLVDERLTSHAAEDMLRSARQSGLRRRRVRKEDIDSLSARLIAEAWLESVQREGLQPEEGSQ